MLLRQYRKTYTEKYLTTHLDWSNFGNWTNLALLGYRITDGKVNASSIGATFAVLRILASDQGPGDVAFTGWGNGKVFVFDEGGKALFEGDKFCVGE